MLVLVVAVAAPAANAGALHNIVSPGDATVAIAPGAGSDRQAKTSVGEPTDDGFILAWLVMLLLLVSLFYAVFGIICKWRGYALPTGPEWLSYALPVLCLIGLGVAIYLSYVETTATVAVCGPVGDCNTVQASPYSHIAGILPVGVFGAAGYIALLAAWLWGRLRHDALASYAPLAIFAMSLFGVAFTIYLTALELFVITAICMWCIVSAVIMVLLLTISAGPGLKQAPMRQ